MYMSSPSHIINEQNFTKFLTGFSIAVLSPEVTSVEVGLSQRRNRISSSPDKEGCLFVCLFFKNLFQRKHYLDLVLFHFS